MLYMLLICYDPNVPADPNRKNLQPEHAKLEAELRAEGKYVDGAALWPIERARTVRKRDGKSVRGEGPFPETKEAVGGYFLVECDEDEALRIAERIPVEDGGRSWIQVREVALLHADVGVMSKLDGWVDPRLRGMREG
jgi:hypothetical protein